MRFLARARHYAAAFCIIMRFDVTRKLERISAILAGRVSSNEVARHAVDLLQRDRPDHRDAALSANVAAVSLTLLYTVTFVFAGRLTKPLNPHRLPRCVPVDGTQ